MPLVKICGLSRMEDVEAVNRHRPDFVGFVFAESRRRVEPEQARRLARALDRSIGAVGVFVNAPLQAVADTACLCGLAAVQLHGGEGEDYIRALRPLLPPGCEIWKAVRVRGGSDIAAARSTGADRLLFDAFSQEAAGGTGQSFDWALIPKTGVDKPFFLAGGITPENAAQAVRIASPQGIDASSSVETGGFKDAEKIRRLIEAVRNASVAVP